jgi:hypothetical protein
MAVPALPEYITGAYATSYIAACNDEVKQRFADLQKKRGVTIPNDSKVLRTEQLRLFMDAI